MMPNEPTTSSGPIDMNEIGTLINKMLREMAIGQTGVPHDPDKPVVYNFTIKVNAQGIEIEDGSQKKEQETSTKAIGREPIIEVLENPNKVMIVAELPGVKREEIEILADAATLSIKTESGDKSFNKTIQLPSKITPRIARATYNNGVLEVMLKKSVSYKGTEMKIVVK